MVGQWWWCERALQASGRTAPAVGVCDEAAPRPWKGEPLQPWNRGVQNSQHTVVVHHQKKEVVGLAGAGSGSSECITVTLME
jgi:hypothetical protein